MTISQVPYERLDVTGYIERVERYTARLRDAASADEAAAVLLDYIADERHAATALTLSAIRSSCNTADGFYEAEEQYYAQAMPPLLEKLNDMYRAMLASPFRPQLEQRFGSVAFKNAEIALKTISPEILPLLEEESLLEIEYQKLQGSLTV